MGMTLTILGCSGSYPAASSACSSYLVRTPSTTVWVDAGSGSLANLQRHIDPLDVDAVVLSHEHPDHTADLAGYYVACKHYLERSRVPVYAPQSVREVSYYDGPPLDWQLVTDDSREVIGDLTFTFSRTDHGPETLAMRIDGGGRSLGYSADSGPGWALSKLGPGLHLALCEATYLRDEEGRAGHMSARQAGQTGRDAEVERLVLTHLKPGLDPPAARAEAEASFGRAVEMAAMHEVYEV